MSAPKKPHASFELKIDRDKVQAALEALLGTNAQAPSKAIAAPTSGPGNVVPFPAKSPLERALWLAAKGFSVFPLQPGTKDKYFNDASDHGATKDPERIRQLFAQPCNVGIWLGREFVAICPDLYLKGAPEAWAQFLAETGPLPPTFTTASARGGEHYMFRTGGRVFSQSSPWKELIDIRATGGYVLAPGSTFIAPDGTHLTYGLKHDAAEIPVIPDKVAAHLALRAPKPERMDPLVEPDQPGALARGWQLVEQTRPAAEGERNNAAHKLAGLIKAQGVSEIACCEMVLKWNEGNTPPLDSEEVEKAVESSYQNGGWRIGEHDPKRHFDTVEAAPGTVPPTQQGSTWRNHVLSASVLEHKQFQPVRWAVPGLVPEGLAMIAGRPKLGKSWLALDMAIARAVGSECLGIQCEPGDVLYLALEDNQRRLQRRMRRLKLKDWPERLTITTQWRRLDQGGVTDITEWADSVAKPSLVLIDTFATVKPITKTKGYEEDYASLSPLHRMAGERGFGVVVLHHQRKQGADDPLDSISGTLGIAGCIDTPIVLARGAKGTTLYIRGRDVEEAEHAVEFDKATCRWRMLGPAADVQRSRERQVVLGALRTSPEPVKVATLVEMTQMQRANLDVLLSKMVQEGEITRAGRGLYTVATASI